MSDLPNVTVCGCGSGGMAMAADLAMIGCRTNNLTLERLGLTGMSREKIIEYATTGHAS